MGNSAPQHQHSDNLSTFTRLRDGSLCVVDPVPLAEGGFSTIYAVSATAPGSGEKKQLALKRIRTLGREQEIEALTEIRMHALLASSQCPFVVQLVEAHVLQGGTKDQRELFLFYPLFTQGTLSKLLLANHQFLSEKRILELFLCCCNAIEAIHALNVAHLDCKSLNFMMRDDHCVLIDFGSARSPLVRPIQSKADALQEQERAERCTSAAYRAPELWDVSVSSNLDYSACDVFSLGCIFYSMVFEPRGYSPFESPSQGILSLAARTASFSFPDKACEIVRGSRELISRMLSIQPPNRPSAKQVCTRIEELLNEIQQEDFDVNFQ